MSKEPLTETPDTGPQSPDADSTAPEAKPAPEGEHRTDGAEQDGPVSESDALRNLTESTSDADAERSDALRAGAIADLIAQRLNDDASGTRIGTLALFNETVSFGGGFNPRVADAGRPRAVCPRSRWIRPRSPDTPTCSSSPRGTATRSASCARNACWC